MRLALRTLSQESAVAGAPSTALEHHLLLRRRWLEVELPPGGLPGAHLETLVVLQRGQCALELLIAGVLLDRARDDLEGLVLLFVLQQAPGVGGPHQALLL